MPCPKIIIPIKNVYSSAFRAHTPWIIQVIEIANAIQTNSLFFNFLLNNSSFLAEIALIKVPTAAIIPIVKDDNCKSCNKLTL